MKKKVKEQNIYFLENIISHNDSKQSENEFSTAILLKASEESSLKNDEDNHNIISEIITNSQIQNFKEGQYVYYKKQNFENANTTSIAKRNVYYNNYLRGRLMKLNENRQYENIPFYKPEIYSYHINVGHGNCSIVVIKDIKKTKLWMVDCSEFDFLNRQNYYSNIESCFDHIIEKFKLKRIHIEKFFLTHTHYDHYSGINRLINNGYINSNTVFFLNLHYSMPSENYNRLLRNLVLIKPLIIEPLTSYSNDNISIWHPHKTTIRTNTPNYNAQDVEIELSPNNSSAVYHLKFGDLSILLPGDIEQEGWNTITQCKVHLNHSSYFSISHHGSINGHLRDRCPVGRSIQDLSNCIMPKSTPILMGRNGAYNGVYSSHVLADFNNIACSEKDSMNNPSNFLEINWQNNNKNWY